MRATLTNIGKHTQRSAILDTNDTTPDSTHSTAANSHRLPNTTVRRRAIASLQPFLQLTPPQPIAIVTKFLQLLFFSRYIIILY